MRLNRLTQSTVTNPANNGPTNDYHYDAMGNITSRTIAGTSETYNYDPYHPYAVDTVTSGGSTLYSASYDADGDMTARNGYPITWTVDNLPESIASASGSSTFSYGPDGNRYSQAATFNGVTTDTTYIGGLFEVVSTSTTTEYRHNIIADGEIVAVHTIDQSGNAYTDYLHYDQLGSVDTITDDQGNVIQTMSFDAFGQRRDPNNWDYDLSQNTISTLKNYTDRGYTDQEQLDNLSLVDMNGRVYDPTTGRMISADPTVPAPLNSQAFNRYSYVYNSPLEFTDPSGFGGAKDPVCPGGPLTCKKVDGSGSSGQNQTPETGSHIPGVHTGCSGCGSNSGYVFTGGSGITTGGSQYGSGSASTTARGGSRSSGTSVGSSLTGGGTGLGSCAFTTCMVLPPIQVTAPFNDIGLQLLQEQLGSWDQSSSSDQSNGDRAQISAFLKKHGALDLSLHLAYGPGVILNLSFNLQGVAWGAAWAPGIALDFSAGGSANLFNDVQGFYGGVDIAGGIYGFGGDLLLGAGASGLIMESTIGYNLGAGVQGVFGYEGGSFTYDEILNAATPTNYSWLESIHP